MHMAQVTGKTLPSHSPQAFSDVDAQLDPKAPIIAIAAAGPLSEVFEIWDKNGLIPDHVKLIAPDSDETDGVDVLMCLSDPPSLPNRYKARSYRIMGPSEVSEEAMSPTWDHRIVCEDSSPESLLGTALILSGAWGHEAKPSPARDLPVSAARPSVRCASALIDVAEKGSDMLEKPPWPLPSGNFTAVPPGTRVPDEFGHELSTALGFNQRAPNAARQASPAPVTWQTYRNALMALCDGSDMPPGLSRPHAGPLSDPTRPALWQDPSDICRPAPDAGTEPSAHLSDSDPLTVRLYRVLTSSVASLKRNRELLLADSAAPPLPASQPVSKALKFLLCAAVAANLAVVSLAGLSFGGASLPSYLTVPIWVAAPCLLTLCALGRLWPEPWSKARTAPAQPAGRKEHLEYLDAEIARLTLLAGQYLDHERMLSAVMYRQHRHDSSVLLEGGGPLKIHPSQSPQPHKGWMTASFDSALRSWSDKWAKRAPKGAPLPDFSTDSSDSLPYVDALTDKPMGPSRSEFAADLPKILMEDSVMMTLPVIHPRSVPLRWDELLPHGTAAPKHASYSASVPGLSSAIALSDPFDPAKLKSWPKNSRRTDTGPRRPSVV